MAKSDKVQQLTASPLDERLENLKKLFPEFFTEGKLDVPKLQELLGTDIEDGAERYRFAWTGKRDAIQLLQTPTRATLTPCREESVDFDATGNVFIEGDNLEVLKLLYKPWERSYSQHPKNYKTFFMTTPDTILNTVSAGMM